MEEIGPEPKYYQAESDNGLNQPIDHAVNHGDVVDTKVLFARFGRGTISRPAGGGARTRVL